MQRSLDNWVDSYLRYTRYHEAQEKFHRWTALTVLSTAVNRNCWMDGGYFKVFPNLYVLFIGPSGIGKSSSSGMGISLLQETSLKLNIYKDSITSAALLKFMSESVMRMEIEGKFVKKTPVLLYASELGNLLSIRTGARELTLLLTELFNKTGDHEDRTNSRGTISIVKPCLNFHGCCFPGWIDEELPSSSLRSGFLGRMLTVKAEKKRHHCPNPPLTAYDAQLKKDLVADLEIIGALYGQMSWTEEAQEAWTNWYLSLPLGYGPEYDGAEVEGFLSRKPQFVQRIAMLHAVARKDFYPKFKVDLEDFKFGLAMVAECEGATTELSLKTDSYRDVERVRNVIIRKALKSKPHTRTVPINYVMQTVSWKLSKKQLFEILEQLYVESWLEVRDKDVFVIGDIEGLECPLDKYVKKFPISTKEA